MNPDLKTTSNPPSAASPAALTALGFDADRLARVHAAVISDIEHGRYHGLAMRVARGGTTVLDLCEGYADRAAGTPRLWASTTTAPGPSTSSRRNVTHQAGLPVDVPRGMFSGSVSTENTEIEYGSK